MIKLPINQEDPNNSVRARILGSVITVFIVCVVLLGTGYLQERQAVKAKERLGGDVEIVANIPVPMRANAFMMFSAKSLSRTAEVESVAMFEDKQVPVTLKGIDRSYPLYGTLELTNQLTKNVYSRIPSQKAWGIAASPSLLDKLGITVGGYVKVGPADYTVNATIASFPEQSDSKIYIVTGKDALFASRPPMDKMTYRYRMILRDNTSLEDWKQKLAETFPNATGKWTVTDWRSQTSVTYTLLGAMWWLALAVIAIEFLFLTLFLYRSRT